MDKSYSSEPMLDIFIYETAQNIEQLEAAIMNSERESCFKPAAINEIFRVMHTIKGSSAMMMYDNIASLAHAIEDLFYYIREENPGSMDYMLLSDLVLEGVDFIKLEMEKLKNSDKLDGDPSPLIGGINNFLSSIKDEGASPKANVEIPTAPKYFLAPLCEGGKTYEAVIYFDDECEMVNIRAFAIIHHLGDITDNFRHIPENLIDDKDSAKAIREHGFTVLFRTDMAYREIHDFFAGNSSIRELELREIPDSYMEGRSEIRQLNAMDSKQVKLQTESKNFHQSIISVDVMKLDRLMDLMGEMVIAEAMVTQNPRLKDMQIPGFDKAAAQLRKITDELQDIVMSIRMVPLSTSFHKMHRIVRDVSRKLNKEVDLVLEGENTEVDKNIIEHISDPLMHLVRNAVDHGIETPDQRAASGKQSRGLITLEAKNAGSDVLIFVKDDGKGLDRDSIFKKAAGQGLIDGAENELTDKEIYNMIFEPGFSTNENITEYSGRGVGMDVVVKNLEKIGGTASIESTEGKGTITTMKIPLTLAIIDGMNIRAGKAKYTLPTTSIKETFQAKPKDIIQDPEGNEMIMVRGECYPVIRLHKLFLVQSDTTDLTKGIMLMIEQDESFACLFADELLGQHQVVVKALPSYMRSFKKVTGLSGCTLLGDGSISLILNVGGLINM